MLEIKGKCGACGVEFRRPAADRVPMGYCCRCWETAGRGSTPGYGEDGVCIDGLPCGKPANATDDPHCDLCPNLPDEGKPAADPGAHYRWEIRRRITDDDIARGWVSVKLDPYRIARVAGIQGGPHEHSVKKLLRGEAKGHEARELIREVRCCLDRWEEMLDEDEEGARCR